MVLPSSWKPAARPPFLLQRRVQFCGIQYIARFSNLLLCDREDRQGKRSFIDAQRGAIGITKPCGFIEANSYRLQRINGFPKKRKPHVSSFAFCFCGLFIGSSAHMAEINRIRLGCGSDQD